MTEIEHLFSGLLNSLESDLIENSDDSSGRIVEAIRLVIESIGAECSRGRSAADVSVHVLTVSRTLSDLKVRPQFVLATIIYLLDDLNCLPDIELDLGNDIQSILTNLIELKKFRRTVNKETVAQMQAMNNPRLWMKRSSENTIQALLSVTDYTENLFVLLADRLFRLQHFDKYFLPEEAIKQLVAEDTLSVYSVIAEMLGAWFLKSQLDDTAFQLMNPRQYEQIVYDLSESREERERLVNEAIAVLNEVLSVEGLVAQVSGRAKHIYGIYLKMQRYQLTAKEVNDSLAVRVILETIPDCYRALFLIHDLFELPKGIYGDSPYRDWIERPKPNGYRSIHTTVLFQSMLGNRLLEIQIRTPEMQEVAEYGIAAHWIYRRASKTESGKRRYQRDAESIAQLRKSYEQYIGFVSNGDEL